MARLFLWHVQNELAAELDGMQCLHTLSTTLVQHRDLHRLLAVILDAAVRLGHADKGNVQLFDTSTGALYIVAQRGFAAPFLEFFNGVFDGVDSCGTAMQHGERVIIEDVTQSAVFMGTAALDVMLAAGARAVQSTPLLSHTGRLLGVFSTHYSVPYRPGDREQRLLDLLAWLAADAIERTQAEQAIQQAHAVLEQRVQERTAELATALEALRHEMAERERTEVERQRLEEASQRAEHFALLGRLAAGVSHEIRNPLGVIYLHADILEEELRQIPQHHQGQLRPALKRCKSQRKCCVNSMRNTP